MFRVRRLLALLIDLVGVFLLMTLLALVKPLWDKFPVFQGSGWDQLWALLEFLILWLIYDSFFFLLRKETIGKKWMGLRISVPYPFSAGQFVLRFCLRIFSFFFLWIWWVVDPQHSFHDYFSKTEVMNESL